MRTLVATVRRRSCTLGIALALAAGACGRVGIGPSDSGADAAQEVLDARPDSGVETVADIGVDVGTDPDVGVDADGGAEASVDSGCGDITSDSANCGRCGNVCGRGSVCRRSGCRPSFVDQLDFDGQTSVRPASAVYDEAGNSYVAIQFQTDFEFGPPAAGPLIDARGDPADFDIIVASYNRALAVRWYTHVGGTEIEETPRLAYSDGSLYLAFASASDADLLIETTPVAAGQSVVVTRLDPATGVPVWTARDPIGPAGIVSAIVADATGVVVAGVSAGSYGFGSSTPTPAGASGYVAALDASTGSTFWVRGVGDAAFSASDGPRLTLVDGDVALAMNTHTGDVFVGSRAAGAPSAPRELDILIARVARATGDPIGVRLVENPGVQAIGGIASRAGNVAIFGTTDTAIALPGITARRPFVSGEDGFIITASAPAAGDPVVDGVIHFGGAADDRFIAVAAANNYYYAAGTSGAAAADWGAGPLGFRGGTDVVVAQFGHDLSTAAVHRYSEFAENALDEAPVALAVYGDQMLLIGTHDTPASPRFGGARFSATCSNSNGFAIRLAF